MGFPVGYTELFFPKLLIHTLSFLGFIRKFISWLFKFLGLGDFLESDITWPDRPTHCPEFHSVSAVLIREILPVVKFEDLVACDGETPDSCAVCLYEFESQEEIRRLTNCRHIFHRSCLDRWMDHDQKTCPLCRTPFIPDEMQEAFNERLWAASGIPDFYGEYSSSVSGL
ncbi:zinc finger protein [Macleaya cordata]|uniref:Zinc finger protein n=1 Tax=Macleaya cordata TaxID=56857 RepID=A0A200QU62_MACCD|nr:zinc finger protein [Macleaya cordata]